MSVKNESNTESKPLEVKVKLFRFNPNNDEKPRYETYIVPLLHENMSILSLLVYITENIDPSLAYYYSCRQVGQVGRCGGCDILINGRGGQACVEEAPKPGDEVVIEPPLSLGFQIIKDTISSAHFMKDRDKLFIPKENTSARIRAAYEQGKRE